MPLDEASRRFAFLLAREIRRLGEAKMLHRSRGEAVKFDSISRLATTETRHGEVTRRLYGERIATWAEGDRILRWAWAGGDAGAAFSHGELVFREGQLQGVPQLSMSVVNDLDEEEAKMLATLGALAAHAEDVFVRKDQGNVEFFGLFDAPTPRSPSPGPAKFSVPPPPVVQKEELVRHSTPPPPYRSLPPVAMPAVSARDAIGNGSGPARRVREPSREVFLPAAQAALTALLQASPGYLQALFVVTVDTDIANPVVKRRLIVQLIVLDAAGFLRALDPPRALLEAASAMIDADRREENGTWRKVSARITPKPDGGASLHVDVL